MSNVTGIRPVDSTGIPELKGQRPAGPVAAPEAYADDTISLGSGRPPRAEAAIGFTFSAGQIGGRDAVIHGLRLETGRTLVAGEVGSVSTLASANAGLGNALMVGAGYGLKAEMGGESLKVFWTAQVTGNAGLTAGGPTLGVGARMGVGAQAGILFGEIAREAATNLGTTSATVGVRLRL